MADVINYKIHGDDMQIVEVELNPGEAVRAKAGGPARGTRSTIIREGCYEIK